MKKLQEISFNIPEGTYKIRKRTKNRPSGKMVYYKAYLMMSSDKKEQCMILLNHCEVPRASYVRRRRLFGLLTTKWKRVW